MSVSDEFDGFLRLGRPLCRPGHGFVSYAQLARFGRVQEDKARRVISRLEGTFRGALVGVLNRRLTLTDLGRKVLALAEEFTRLRDTAPSDDAETLVVEAHPAIDRAVLSAAVADFLAEWGEVVAVVVRPSHEGTPAAVQTGEAVFALDLIDPEESGDADERVTFGWRVIAPHSRHFETCEFRTDALTPSDCVAFDGRLFAQLGSMAKATTPVQRVACDSAEGVRQLVRTGVALGLEVDFSVSRVPDLSTRPWDEFPPLVVNLLLPPRPDRMSEPAQALLAAIRHALRPAERTALEAAVTD